MARKSNYTVGITVFLEAGGDGWNFFANGLRQNVIHLAQTFAHARDCKEVILLNEGPGDFQLHSSLGAFKIMKPLDAVGKIDHLITLGAALPVETLKAFRAAGTQIIGYKGGNGAVLSMESVAASPPKTGAEHYADCRLFDQIWLTPQHVHTFASWCRMVYRCPVFVVPQVWSDRFLRLCEQPIQSAFGYKPGQNSWRVGILDPNITVMKTFHIPVLVTEAAYRLNQQAVQRLYITNSIQYMENAHVQQFCSTTDLLAAKRLTVEGRFISWDFIGKYCEAVVTHHWENGLNYLYWDALSGGYPLVHNSEFLRSAGVGYFYESFNAESGGRALVSAFETHDKNLEAYREAATKYLWGMNPANPRVASIHQNLLLGRALNNQLTE